MTPDPRPAWVSARDPGDEDPSCDADAAFFALVEQLRETVRGDDDA